MELIPAAAGRWLLLDKSALVHAVDLDPALGEPCLCAITRFEMLYSARSPRAFEELEGELDALHELRGGRGDHRHRPHGST